MLTLENIACRVEGRLLFGGVNAQIGARRRLGLVGRNGCGKTTLLRLIAGRLEPDEGRIVRARGLSVRLVDQEVPGGPETPRDAVLAGDRERAALIAEAESAGAARRAGIEARLAEIGAHAAPARAARLLAGLGVDEAMQETPLSSLSGGWRMRVALAAALFAEPDLLLLDEPTNHLDLEAAMWLESYLKRYPRALVAVSHDRDLLDAVPDGILHMAGGALTFYPGNYTSFARTHAERLAATKAQQARIDDRRRRLQGFVDRFRYNARKARQAQSRVKALAKLADLPTVADERTAELTFPEPAGLRPPLMTFQDAAVGYEPGRPVLRNLNLRIDPNERIALLGANGNGKSTFARLLADLLPTERGTVTRARNLAVGYFAQHQIDTLRPDATAFGHLAPLMPDALPERVRARLGAFGFGGEKADVPVAALSGGEKARLNLALITSRSPQLLVLDEPTNHLDIESRRALVDALQDFGGAVVLIAHDMHLVQLVADRLWLVRDGTVRPYDGDLDYYRAEILDGAGARRSDGSGRAVSSRKAARRAAAADRDRRKPLKDAVAAAESRIARAQDALRSLHAALASAAREDDAERIAALGRELADAKRAEAAAEGDWFAASEALERAGTG
ncbi:MAG: ABC-F family ATP-binding cassette domain-containing protein [Defluviicoccus sp.]|nr:ABC-F family ATP-binding cassette domain-containing protein [Defluviicoccus sp.]